MATEQNSLIIDVQYKSVAGATSALKRLEAQSKKTSSAVGALTKGSTEKGAATKKMANDQKAADAALKQFDGTLKSNTNTIYASTGAIKRMMAGIAVLKANKQAWRNTTVSTTMSLGALNKTLEHHNRIARMAAFGSIMQITKSFRNMGMAIHQAGVGLTRYVSLMATAATTIGIKMAANIEAQTVRFGILVQDMERGARLFKEIVEYSAATPFLLPDLTRAAQTLLAFGTPVGELLDELRMMGDIAQGNSEKLIRVSESFGKVRSRGTAHMRELNRFIMSGVPIIEQLNKNIGLTGDTLFTMISRNEITFDMLKEAVEDLTSEGGRFHDLTLLVSRTLEGRMSTAIDNMRLNLASLFDSFVEPLKDVLVGFIDWSQGFRMLGDESKKTLAILTVGLLALGPVLRVIGGLISFALVGPFQLAFVAAGALIALFTGAKINSLLKEAGNKAEQLQALTEDVATAQRRAEMSTRGFSDALFQLAKDHNAAAEAAELWMEKLDIEARIEAGDIIPKETITRVKELENEIFNLLGGIRDVDMDIGIRMDSAQGITAKDWESSWRKASTALRKLFVEFGKEIPESISIPRIGFETKDILGFVNEIETEIYKAFSGFEFRRRGRALGVLDSLLIPDDTTIRMYGDQVTDIIEEILQMTNLDALPFETNLEEIGIAAVVEKLSNYLKNELADTLTDTELEKLYERIAAIMSGEALLDTLGLSTKTIYDSLASLVSPTAVLQFLNDLAAKLESGTIDFSIAMVRANNYIRDAAEARERYLLALTSDMTDPTKQKELMGVLRGFFGLSIEDAKQQMEDSSLIRSFFDNLGNDAEEAYKGLETILEQYGYAVGVTRDYVDANVRDAILSMQSKTGKDLSILRMLGLDDPGAVKKALDEQVRELTILVQRFDGYDTEQFTEFASAIGKIPPELHHLITSLHLLEGEQADLDASMLESLTRLSEYEHLISIIPNELREFIVYAAKLGIELTQLAETTERLNKIKGVFEGFLRDDILAFEKTIREAQLNEQIEIFMASIQGMGDNITYTDVLSMLLSDDHVTKFEDHVNVAIETAKRLYKEIESLSRSGDVSNILDAVFSGTLDDYLMKEQLNTAYKEITDAINAISDIDKRSALLDAIGKGDLSDPVILSLVENARKAYDNVYKKVAESPDTSGLLMAFFEGPASFNDYLLNQQLMEIEKSIQKQMEESPMLLKFWMRGDIRDTDFAGAVGALREIYDQLYNRISNSDVSNLLSAFFEGPVSVEEFLKRTELDKIYEKITNELNKITTPANFMSTLLGIGRGDIDNNTISELIGDAEKIVAFLRTEIESNPDLSGIMNAFFAGPIELEQFMLQKQLKAVYDDISEAMGQLSEAEQSSTMSLLEQGLLPDAAFDGAVGRARELFNRINVEAQDAFRDRGLIERMFGLTSETEAQRVRRLISEEIDTLMAHVETLDDSALDRILSGQYDGLSPEAIQRIKKGKEDIKRLLDFENMMGTMNIHSFLDAYLTGGETLQEYKYRREMGIIADQLTDMLSEMELGEATNLLEGLFSGEIDITSLDASAQEAIDKYNELFDWIHRETVEKYTVDVGLLRRLLGIDDETEMQALERQLNETVTSLADTINSLELDADFDLAGMMHLDSLEEALHSLETLNLDLTETQLSTIAELLKLIFGYTGDIDEKTKEMKIKEVFEGMADGIKQVLQTNFIDIFKDFGASLKDGENAFSAMTDGLGSFARAVWDALPSILLQGAMAAWSNGLFWTGLALLAASGVTAAVQGFNSGGQSPTVSHSPVQEWSASAKGDVFRGGYMVDSPLVRSLSDGSMNMIGEAGNEAVLPLKRMPGGDLGVSASVGDRSGGSVNVEVPITVINQSSHADVQQRETTDEYGNKRIELLIIDTVKKGFSSREFDKPLGANYGVQRVGRR